MNFSINRLNLVKRKRKLNQTDARPLYLQTPSTHRQKPKAKESVRIGRLPAVHKANSRPLLAQGSRAIQVLALPPPINQPRLRHSRTAAGILKKQEVVLYITRPSQDEDLDAWDHSLQAPADFTLSKYQRFHGF